jgi:hypothetical protein
MPDKRRVSVSFIFKNLQEAANKDFFAHCHKLESYFQMVF